MIVCQTGYEIMLCVRQNKRKCDFSGFASQRGKILVDTSYFDEFYENYALINRKCFLFFWYTTLTLMT